MILSSQLQAKYINFKRCFPEYNLAAQRSQKAVNGRVRATEFHPDSPKTPNQVALDKSEIPINFL